LDIGARLLLHPGAANSAKCAEDPTTFWRYRFQIIVLGQYFPLAPVKASTHDIPKQVAFPA
jgi:hypothetical protein